VAAPRTPAGAAIAPSGASAGQAHAQARSGIAIALRVLRFVDRSRRVVLPGGRVQARSLVTELRYPLASAGAGGARGPFPLIVFGHGFAVTPSLYAGLLDAWTRAGFVVAAPVFPLGNADAPGGPDESDLPNQPRDVSFVISSLLHAARAGGPLAGLIDPHRIAVAGQSDGGDTALAVAYDPRFRDRRVRAAVILSGAEIPGLGQFAFPRPGPALLATQGSADTINLPAETELFFAAAHQPKFLLRIAGADHLGPYTRRGPELALVERVTIRFLRRYLAGEANVRLPPGAQGGGGELAGGP
jgi:predicted dienelactone hydrolase